MMHKLANFDLNNLNSEKRYNGTQVYNCSKLANILVANELSRKLKGTGTLQHKQPTTFGCLNLLLLFSRFSYAKLIPTHHLIFKKYVGSTLISIENGMLQFVLFVCYAVSQFRLSM